MGGIAFKHNSKALKKRKKSMAVTEKENFKKTKRLRRQLIDNIRHSAPSGHDSFGDDTSFTMNYQNKHSVVDQDSPINEISESGRPRRKASSRIQQMREQGSETSDDFNSSNNPELSRREKRKRPQRECKDRTSTLVAISLAEQDYEKFDLDFERFKSDINSPTPSEGSRIGSRSAEEGDIGPSVSSVQEESIVIVQERNNLVKKKKVKTVNQSEKVNDKVAPQMVGSNKSQGSFDQQMRSEKSEKVEKKKVKPPNGTTKRAQSFENSSRKLEKKHLKDIKKVQSIDRNMKKEGPFVKEGQKFEEVISKKIEEKEENVKPSQKDKNIKKDAKESGIKRRKRNNLKMRLARQRKN